MNICGNTIFIPGSTSGIGLALAARLQARGNMVIVGGRRTKEAMGRAAGPGLAW
jgi:short-subunit dehydrogenase involved in D-alanine esterification of teichoic acids